MLDRVTMSPTERITCLVGQILARRSTVGPVQADDDLGEIGLSSLDMVNLMLAVEEEFDLKIPDKDMTPSNFRSIARIHRLVAGLLAANGRG